MDITERLKKIIGHSGLSDRGFAIQCGLKQPTLDKQLKGLRAVSLDTICAVLVTYPEISSDWLIRGKGDMLNTLPDRSAEMERIDKLVDSITTLQDTINEKNKTIATLQAQLDRYEKSVVK